MSDKDVLEYYKQLMATMSRSQPTIVLTPNGDYLCTLDLDKINAGIHDN